MATSAAAATSAVAWWSSGAVTFVVGHGLAKIVPWPVALLVGGAAAGFTHRSILSAYDALCASIPPIMISLVVSSSSEKRKDEEKTASVDPGEKSSPPIFSSPPSHSHSPSPSPSPPPPAVTPFPKGVPILIRPKRRLAMASITGDDEAEVYDEDAVQLPIDIVQDAIETPPEETNAGRHSKKITDVSYETFVEARKDDPAVIAMREFEKEEALRRPTRSSSAAAAAPGRLHYRP